jgi:hypothetical protein
MISRERKIRPRRGLTLAFLTLSLAAITCVSLSLMAKASMPELRGRPSPTFGPPTFVRDPNFHPMDSRSRTYTLPPEVVPPSPMEMAKWQTARDKHHRLLYTQYALNVGAIGLAIAAGVCLLLSLRKRGGKI